MQNGANSQGSQNVGTTALAALFDISERRVQQLVNDGVLSAIKVKGNLQFNFVSSTKEYIKYLTERAENKSGKLALSDLERQKMEAEVKLKETKAAILELELNELKGTMHSSDDVEAMTTDLIMTVRAMAIALPGRMAVDLATISNPAEIQNRIRAEVNTVLEEITKYKYDPAAYAQRVRERQGDKAGGFDEENDEQ